MSNQLTIPTRMFSLSLSAFRSCSSVLCDSYPAAIHILAALRQKERTGKGAIIGQQSCRVDRAEQMRSNLIRSVRFLCACSLVAIRSLTFSSPVLFACVRVCRCVHDGRRICAACDAAVAIQR